MIGAEFNNGTLWMTTIQHTANNEDSYARLEISMELDTIGHCWLVAGILEQYGR